MSTVLEIAKKLNKSFENDKFALIADVQPTYKRLASGDLGLDFPLYGGLPYGRLVTISGKEHSGKSTAACVWLAAYQRANPDKMCVYVDVEHSLDMVFQASMTGLDLTKLLYINPDRMSGEDILAAVEDLQASDNIGMIVIDSIAALISSRDYDSDVTEDKGMAGSMAKPLGKFIKQMLDKLSAAGNILLLINQVRQVGTMYNGAAILDEPCGHAPKYYASIKLRFGTRTFTNGDKVDLRDGENADGFRLSFATTKNKTASIQRGGGFMTFRYDKGLDWSFDLLEVAIRYDFIQRPNTKTYVLTNLLTGETYTDPETGEVLSFFGKAKLKEYLESHVEFQKIYLEMLNTYISAHQNQYGSLLDSRLLAEIKEEESRIEDKKPATRKVLNENIDE